MKEIGPIPRKLCPFESTPGHPSDEFEDRLDIRVAVPTYIFIIKFFAIFYTDLHHKEL